MRLMKNLIGRYFGIGKNSVLERGVPYFLEENKNGYTYLRIIVDAKKVGEVITRDYLDKGLNITSMVVEAMRELIEEGLMANAVDLRSIRAKNVPYHKKRVSFQPMQADIPSHLK